MARAKKRKARRTKAPAARKYGWSGGRYEKHLGAARAAAKRLMGSAQLVVLENHDLVVIHRKMIVDLINALRTSEDYQRLQRVAVKAFEDARSSWA